jgi:hypothetical protein
MTCEDMIDNELEWPWLEQLQSSYEYHLDYRHYKEPAIGTEPLIELARQGQ